MIKALIFDLDGTLLDTVEDLEASMNFALGKLNYPQKTTEEIKSYLGNGVEYLIGKSLPDGKYDPAYKECMALFKEHYNQNMFNKTAPYPGIIDVLKALKEKEYGLAIVSNKYDEAVRELNEKFFKEYIDVAMGQSHLVQKKPAPDIVFNALRDLHINVGEAVYVGDSEVDIQTARNALSPCISVTWGFRSEGMLLAAGARYIAKKPEDILTIMKESFNL